MKSEIINYIRRNRVSTTEVADCLGKAGAIENVMPINSRHFKVGNVKWVYAYKESNWDVHKQIVDTNEGDIVFIDAIDCKHRAIIGDLVSKYILLYKQATAIVTNSKMRDAAALIRENYPIWCTGVTPVGCFNTKPEPPLAAEIESRHREMYDGTIAVCDDCGVVIIPKEHHTQEFLQKLKNIEEQEDIWFDRLDRHKESTFDIVCLKKYLSDDK
ncbi:MAG: RraA family protein [Clostridia bacterium]|nr:RraA family protein [Clostridia bacterium]